MMKLTPVDYKRIAFVLFSNATTKPRIEFYISKNPITGKGEGACALKIISIADDVTVVGNYYGGGLPFCYDMTSDESFDELAEALKEYFYDIGAGDSIYVETNFGSVDELPIGKGYSERERVVIIVEDGMVTDVSATNREILCEIIDKDNQDPDHQEDLEKEVSEFREQMDNGTLKRIW